MATSKIINKFNLITLWTNSNPSDDFVNQRISFDKEVKGVIIKYRERKTGPRGFSLVMFYANESTPYKLDGFVYSTSPYNYYLRPVHFNNPKALEFEDCYAMTSYGTYGNIDNSYAIPVLICGIC